MMADFINTVDVLGDKDVVESIIDGTITEYNDDNVDYIGIYAFRDCKALVTVNCPNVAEVKDYAFNYCTNLRTATFINATTLGNDAFRDCTQLQVAEFHKLTTMLKGWPFRDCKALTTLILRSEILCSLNSTYTFYNTPIASGTGYIYVPRALLSDDDATKDYRMATNWSTYASQFRALEDYTVDGTTTGELDATKI